MISDNLIGKLSTNVRGLDELLYGGIQLRSLFNDDEQKQGIIIVIRGPKGSHKTILALQMLHGLTKSFLKMFPDKATLSSNDACFFSFSKNKKELEDMYLDFIVNRQIERMIQENISGINEETGHATSWNNSLLSDCIFNTNNNTDVGYSCQSNIKLPSDFRVHLDRYLCERNLYYNIRTSSLHFRNKQNKDDNGNSIFKLKHNTVAEYVSDDSLQRLPPNYLEDFVRIDFDTDEWKTNSAKQTEFMKSDSYQYPQTVNERLQKIVNALLSFIEEKQDKKMYSPCLVIDGFSHIDDEKLKEMPFATIQDALRKSTPISILIFDERFNDIKINADVIIDTRVKDDPEVEYTYHELQISKSDFQTVAFGWHQYKKRDYGIDVFPSLHRLLQKRRYLPHILLSTHSSIIEQSYGQYLDSLDENCVDTSTDYDLYERNKLLKEEERLKAFYDRYYKVADNGSSTVVDKGKLSSVLFNETNDPIQKDSTKTTAIIGNANCFKRLLACSGALHAALNGEHTLIVLFDREENDMIKQMPCPAFHQDNLFNGDKDKKHDCRSCYEKLHFLGIRMGCISAEEFFYVLQSQINVTFKGEKKFKRIIIDDLQKFDYCFPFLKNTSLFLPALIYFCRNNGINLTVLCDKKASRVHELCTLADNVVCIKRDDEVYEKAITAKKTNDYIEPFRSIELFLERNAYHTQPSEILRFTIHDVLKLFNCEDRKLFINNNLIECSQLCSMKEYWRNSYNIYKKENQDSI